MVRKVLIQIRRGLEKDIGTLAEGELGYCTDTQKLYVGTVAGNVLLVAAQTVGDMLKSVYDTNNDGVVDAASSVPWLGITGKPSTFAPAAHTHDVLKNKVDNWRDGLSLPSTYEIGETIFFSNTPANKFNNISYCTVHTIRGYGGFANCIQYIYPYNVDAPIMYRYSIYSADSWLGWRKLSIEGHTHAISNVTGLQAALDGKMKKGPLTWNDLKGV